MPLSQTHVKYLSLVESVRVDGKNTHRTLFRLGEASALRETGEPDRIIAALQAHAERRNVELDQLEVDAAPMIGTMAVVRALWDELGLQALFDTIGEQAGCVFSLADAVFAMLAGRLVDPASKRRTHRWIVEDVVAPDAFSFPTLDQYYRALDLVHGHKDLIERHVYARVCDLTNLQLTLACYDLTSSYLEGDPASHGRFPSKAFGYSRDGRGDRPQVVIGLLTSGDGIPIAHHVFAGGTSDATTLKGVLEDLTDRFAVGRICVVADRGLMGQLLALERRVKRGDLVAATDIAAAAATVLARSPVKRLFDVSDVADGRFVYDYHHDQLAYDEQLAGHYVLATSLDPSVADAAEVLACYRSLQSVEQRFRVMKSSLGLRPIRHFTENRVRGHIAICVLAAVAESMIGKRLVEADLHDPDLDNQHLTTERAFEELDRIRQVTFTAGERTITAITRRTGLQQQILDALGVDTSAWTRPQITS